MKEVSNRWSALLALPFILFVFVFTSAFDCDDDGGSGPQQPPIHTDPLKLEVFPLPVALTNAPYSVTIKPRGGTRPYSYYIPMMPYGMHFVGSEDSLQIVGTHASGGGYPINITVTDADTNEVTAQFHLLFVHEANLTGTWSYKVRGHADHMACGCQADDRWTQTYTLNIEPDGDGFIASGYHWEPTHQSRITTPEDIFWANMWDTLMVDTCQRTERHMLRFFSLGNVYIDSLAGDGHWSMNGGPGLCGGGLDISARVVVKGDLE